MGFIDELLVKIGLTGDREFKRQIRSVRRDTERETKGMVNSFKSVATAVKTFIGAAIVREAGRAVIALTQLAERQRVLEASSKRLAAGIGQNYQHIERAITKGLNGAISRIDALKFANQAILLGLPVTTQSMEELSRTALRLGRAMNVGPEQALESLVVGIGRQSKLWLDNLGIIIDTEAAYRKMADELGVTVEQLTDAQKKMAFWNTTMEAARAKSQELGDVTASLDENWARFQARIENIAAAFGSVLVPKLDAALIRLNKMLDWAEKFGSVGSSAANALGTVVRTMASTNPLGHAAMLGFDALTAGGAKGSGGPLRPLDLGNPFGINFGPPSVLRPDYHTGPLPAPGFRSPTIRDASAKFQTRDTFSAATGEFGKALDVPMIKEKAKKAAKVAFVEFESIPDKMGDSFESNLMKMEAQMQAFGLKGRGIFGGMANMRAGFSSLGMGGENKTLKALSDVAGKIAGVGQIIGGVVGIASAFGIGGPSFEEQVKSMSDSDLRAIAGREDIGNLPFSNIADDARTAKAEIERRRTQGSQTIGGTVTTLTDATGKLMLAETSSMNSAVQQYLPYLETMDLSLRSLAAGGINADTLTRNRRAAGVG